MPRHAGKKFRTVFAFGKKKRKRKITTQAEKKSAETATDLAVPSTSTGVSESTPLLSSKRKLDVFTRKHVCTGDSDSSSDEEPPSKKSASVPEVQLRSGQPQSSQNIIVDVSTLDCLVSSVHCGKCISKVSVFEDETKRMGSACSLEVRCVSCGAVIPGTQTMTSLKTGTVFTGFDINLVAAASATGIGYTQLCRFFGMVNMPRPMHQKTWLHYQKKYSEGASRAASTHLQDAAHHVREAYAEMGLGQPSALLDVLAELDLVAGSNAQMFAEKSDMLRVKTATRKSSDRAKQKRKKIETVRRQEREHRRADEGEVYTPGAF
ncbi:uncharacterized protein LOC143287445 [Babylonia areolata]|uniref:uncharacterized protein LOC143287445 n=1 Tax=Babylonia areolata TaxID=304850 RepID=UPI003FD1A77D